MLATRDELKLKNTPQAKNVWHWGNHYFLKPASHAWSAWLHTYILNSLAPSTFWLNFKWLIFKQILVIDGWVTRRWMSQGLTDDKSTLVQVMDWCRQAASHYLSQCSPSSMSPLASLGHNVFWGRNHQIYHFVNSAYTSWRKWLILTSTASLNSMMDWFKVKQGYKGKNVCMTYLPYVRFWCNLVHFFIFQFNSAKQLHGTTCVHLCT